MSTPTNKLAGKQDKRKQWLWFIGIWTASLLCVLTLGYFIKFVMFLI